MTNKSVMTFISVNKISVCDRKYFFRNNPWGMTRNLLIQVGYKGGGGAVLLEILYIL